MKSIECPNCGFVLIGGDVVKESINFCPKCGKQMKEPFLYTFDQLHKGMVVYIEDDSPLKRVGYVEYESYNILTKFIRFFGNATASDYTPETYGKQWRAWSVKPSMEQMENTPWEDRKK